MKNKGLIAAVVIAIVSAAVIVFAIMPKVNKQTVNNEEKTVKTSTGEVIDKPTFMYFVTKADLEDKTTKDLIDKLAEEFGDKVLFDIKNVDEDKKLLDNFPIVKDNTPALIMLKADGDISTFLFKTNEYEKLKLAIETEVK